MFRCYVCDVVLTRNNNSSEHIIPNSCGGRLKSFNLLCKQCNSYFGKTCDSALAKQMNILANILDIKRENGEPQPIVATKLSTNETYRISVGGRELIPKPKVFQSRTDDQVEISITARNNEEFRKILVGLKRKYPKLDVDEFLKQAKFVKKYLDEPLQHSMSSVGGPDALRAICKIAINFFLYSGGNKNEIQHHLPFIKGNSDSDFVNPILLERRNLSAKEYEVSHTLYVKGSGGILFATVELFSVYGFLVILNHDYHGPDLEYSYCYDLLESREVKKSIDFPFEKKWLLEYDYRTDSFNSDGLVERLKCVLVIGYRRQHERRRNELISESVEKVFSQYPLGSDVTPQFINHLVSEVVNAVTPLYFRRQKKEILD